MPFWRSNIDLWNLQVYRIVPSKNSTYEDFSEQVRFWIFFLLFFEKRLSSQYFKCLYLIQYTKIVRRDELYKLDAKNRSQKAFLVENLDIFSIEVDFFQKSKIFKIQVFDLKLTRTLEITSDSCSTHPKTVVG